MTTNFYHRLEDIVGFPQVLKLRKNVYHALAEKAECSTRDVIDLAYSGLRIVDVDTAHKIIYALGIILDKRIGSYERSHLFADDDTTIEQHKKHSMHEEAEEVKL